MLRALGDIEKVENQTVQIKDTFLENLQEVGQINTSQALLLDELKVIEGELDRYLDGQAGPSNKFLQNMLAGKGYEVSDRE